MPKLTASAQVGFSVLFHLLHRLNPRVPLHTTFQGLSYELEDVDGKGWVFRFRVYVRGWSKDSYIEMHIQPHHETTVLGKYYVSQCTLWMERPDAVESEVGRLQAQFRVVVEGSRLIFTASSLFDGDLFNSICRPELPVITRVYEKGQPTFVLKCLGNDGFEHTTIFNSVGDAQSFIRSRAGESPLKVYERISHAQAEDLFQKLAGF